jgi:hypothetical protein
MRQKGSKDKKNVVKNIKEKKRICEAGQTSVTEVWRSNYVWLKLNAVT